MLCNIKKAHIVVAISVLTIAVLAYFAGYKVAYDKFDEIADSTAQQGSDFQAFYATITEITDTHITVEGMDINDINFRGHFSFPIMGETSYLWRMTEISPSELDENDRISILFVGEVQESYPGQIKNVITVTLLDDEK